MFYQNSSLKLTIFLYGKNELLFGITFYKYTVKIQ